MPIHVLDEGAQLGPQQLKYMTILRDSSDLLWWRPETTAEDDGDNFLAWERGLTRLLAYCCADLMAWFHLHIPWSFSASTTPTLAATTQAFAAELINFFPSFFRSSSTVALVCDFWSGIGVGGAVYIDVSRVEWLPLSAPLVFCFQRSIRMEGFFFSGLNYPSK